MAESKDYKKLYEEMLSYSRTKHQMNQKKIRIGLTVNIFVPLIFLVLSFIISEAKLVFLLLWIVSLFGIAFYLIYVEFSDYKMQDQWKEMGIGAKEEESDASLLGSGVEQAGQKVSEHLDYVDSRIEEEKQRLENEIAERRQRLMEIVAQRGKKEEEDHEEHH